MRHILTIPKVEEDWRRTNAFHTYSEVGNKSCKVINDGGNRANVISTEALKKTKLKPETYSQPYKVTWLNKVTILVN